MNDCTLIKNSTFVELRKPQEKLKNKLDEANKEIARLNQIILKHLQAVLSLVILILVLLLKILI